MPHDPGAGAGEDGVRALQRQRQARRGGPAAGPGAAGGADLGAAVDDQRAETRYQTVIDLESDNQTALAALERIYRLRNDSTLLAEMLLVAAALEIDHAKKKALLSEAAELYQVRSPR